MKNKKYCVYMHICPNNKKYIGKTSLKLNKRCNNGKGYKNNYYFYPAILKYGWDHIEHIILKENLSETEADMLEIKLIEKYHTRDVEYGYNILKGGEKISMINKRKNKLLQITLSKGVYEALDECCKLSSKNSGTNISKSDLIEHLIIDYFRTIICSAIKDVSATSDKN